MKQFKHISLTILTAAALSFSAVKPSSAIVIPVADLGTIAQGFINNAKQLIEFPFIVQATDLQGTMNSTIGTAKSTFANFFKEGNHKGDGNSDVGEYDQDYDHLPDNDHVAGPKDAVIDIEDMGGNYIPEGYEYTPTPKEENHSSLENQSEIIFASNTISGHIPMAMAQATQKKYSGSTNKGFVFSDELAEYCKLNVSDVNELKKKDNMIKCMKKLLKFRASPYQNEQREARDIYIRAFNEMAFANTAEALVVRNFAIHYEKEVLKPMAKKAEKAKTERDDFATVVAANIEITNLLNKLLSVYSERISFDTYRDYGDFELYNEDWEKKPKDNPKGTVDNVYIVPEEFVDHCGLDATKWAKKLKAERDKKENGDTASVIKGAKEEIVACMKMIIKERHADDQAQKREIRDIYVRGLHEESFANTGESLVNRDYSLNYENNVITPLKELAVTNETSQKDYKTIIKANTEFANMLSRVLMAYSSRVAYGTLKTYGDYEIYPDEKLEID